MTHHPVGDTATEDIAFDAAGIADFATRAGDHNPLHHDAAYAAQTRFGGIIASGTHYTARMMGLVATHFTQHQPSVGLDFQFTFRHAVHAGAAMRIVWEVVASENSTRPKGEILHLHGTLVDVASGRVMVESRARILIL